MNNAAVAANVPEATKNSFPMGFEQCIVEDPGCPTLDKWCGSGDASTLCGETPFTEETTVNAGIVAGITVSAAVLLIAAIVTLLIRRNKRMLLQQKERLQNMFAKRIVSNFNIRHTGEALTMEALTEQFKLIDSGSKEGGDGVISKAVSSFIIELSFVSPLFHFSRDLSLLPH